MTQVQRPTQFRPARRPGAIRRHAPHFRDRTASPPAAQACLHKPPSLSLHRAPVVRVSAASSGRHSPSTSRGLRAPHHLFWAAIVYAISAYQQVLAAHVQRRGLPGLATGPSHSTDQAATTHWSSPWRKMSCGRSMPIKTILLWRCSSASHSGPRSLPISWCTPWKITLRFVPFIAKTPL